MQDAEVTKLVLVPLQKREERILRMMTKKDPRTVAVQVQTITSPHWSQNVKYIEMDIFRGTRVAQLVKWPTSAQVMISWFGSLSLMSGSALAAWSLLKKKIRK